MTDDRRHRYLWECIWDSALPPLTMIALNPSVANEVVDDPTVERMVNRARQWGYGRFMMLNAAAFRSRWPADLNENPEAIGPDNDAWISRIVQECVREGGLLLYGWGANLATARPGRDKQVDAIARAAGANPHALRLTIDGHPEHPLYLAYALQPVPFEFKAAGA